MAPVSRRAGAFLALLPLLFTGKALLTGGIYGPADLYYGVDPWRNAPAAAAIAPAQNPILSDVAFANLPWRSAVRESFARGRVPFWNRFVLSGSPLFPGAGDGYLHPAVFLGLLLPLGFSFLFSCTFTLFLGLLSAYLFLRDHGTASVSALLGAVAWAFSTTLLFWHGFAIGPAIATLPLLLLALRRLAREPGPGAVGLGVVALLLLLAGGHPESFFHGVAAGAVYFLWELAARPRPRPARPIGAAALAGLLSLLIGAPLVLPLLDALPRTAIHRARRVSVAAQARGQSVAAAEAARRLLPAALPFAHGIYGRSPVQGWRQDGSGMPLAYSGAVLFPLALLGIRSRRRGRGLFLALSLAGLGYGASAPVLLDLTSAIPGFDVALNYRMVFLAPLGLAGLAAFGADELSRGARRPFLFAAAGSLAVLLLLFTLSGGLFRARELSRVFVWTSFAVEVLPLVLLAGAAAPRRMPGGSLAGLALLLLAGQRHLEMGGVYPTLPAGALAPALPTLASLPRAASPYRIVAAQDVFRPNGATLYGLEDVRGYEPFTLAELAEVFPLWCRPQHAAHTRVEDLTRPFLAFLNARFAIAPPDGAVPPGWREVSRGKEMALFENPRALERAFAPRRVRSEQDPRSRLQQMARETDFSERVWVSEEGGAAGEETQNGTAQLLVRSAGPDLHVTADVSSRALVATSVPAWPGWTAETPRGRLKILRVNHAFVGFWIDPGRHEVRLRYRPPMLTLALVLCLVGVFLAAVLAVAATIHRKF